MIIRTRNGELVAVEVGDYVIAQDGAVVQCGRLQSITGPIDDIYDSLRVVPDGPRGRWVRLHAPGDHESGRQYRLLLDGFRGHVSRWPDGWAFTVTRLPHDSAAMYGFATAIGAQLAAESVITRWLTHPSTELREAS